MAGIITTREGMNGPLGNVSSITGTEGMELLRLVVILSALKMYAKTGLKVTRNFNMKVVKQTTGLKTNDKQKHITALENMIEDVRSKCTFIGDK